MLFTWVNSDILRSPRNFEFIFHFLLTLVSKISGILIRILWPFHNILILNRFLVRLENLKLLGTSLLMQNWFLFLQIFIALAKITQFFFSQRKIPLWEPYWYLVSLQFKFNFTQNNHLRVDAFDREEFFISNFRLYQLRTARWTVLTRFCPIANDLVCFPPFLW